MTTKKKVEAEAPSDRSAEVREQFRSAEAALNELLIERSPEIRGLMLAALTSEHVFQLGKPGVAKSLLCEAFAYLFEANYFAWQFSRYTTPDEIFGATDIMALKQGHVKRITTGKLPWAAFAYLDEIWRGSSAVLDTTNALLNERRFYNDGGYEQCPLVTAVTAANSLPEESLEASYDRFLFRFNVGDLSDGGLVELMTRQAMGFDWEDAKKALPIIGLPALQDAQGFVKAQPVDIATVAQATKKIRQALAQLPNPMYVSPRRIAKSIRVMQANAWLDGRDEAGQDDITVLNDILWDNPEQIASVKQVVAAFANPLLSTALGFKKNVEDMVAEVEAGNPGESRRAAASTAFNRGCTALKEIDKAQSTSFAVATTRREIAALVKRVAVNELGMKPEQAENAVSVK